MTNYRRHRVAGGTYFFTVNLFDRRLRLLTDHVEALKSAIREVKTHHPFKIEAIVVLPDHLHAIWTLPEGDSDYSTRWRLIKSHFSHTVPREESRSKTRAERGEREVWQRRFWEHTLRDDLDFERHVDYIHFNPVKHRYVSQVADWPYSSFASLVRQGVYPMDWAGKSDLMTGDFGER